jgi:hypothetical protein
MIKNGARAIAANLYLILFIVRLKFQKRSELKFVSRTIPQSGGCNTPQRAFEFVSKACFGVSYP